MHFSWMKFISKLLVQAPVEGHWILHNLYIRQLDWTPKTWALTGHMVCTSARHFSFITFSQMVHYSSIKHCTYVHGTVAKKTWSCLNQVKSMIYASSKSYLLYMYIYQRWKWSRNQNPENILEILNVPLYTTKTCIFEQVLPNVHLLKSQFLS